jgi:hypothetical protein
MGERRVDSQQMKDRAHRNRTTRNDGEDNEIAEDACATFGAQAVCELQLPKDRLFLFTLNLAWRSDEER